MSVLLLSVAVGLILAAVWLLGSAIEDAVEACKQQRLVRELEHADRLVARDAAEAKRAMNEAAGQSWRNLVE